MVRFWQDGSGHASLCPDAKRLLRILGTDPVMEILVQLARGEMAVNDLADALDLAGDCMTRNLKLLHGASMVAVTRIKQRHLYHLGQGVSVQFSGPNVRFVAKAADGSEVSLAIPCERIRIVSPRPIAPMKS